MVPFLNEDNIKISKKLGYVITFLQVRHTEQATIAV